MVLIKLIIFSGGTSLIIPVINVDGIVTYVLCEWGVFSY